MRDMSHSTSMVEGPVRPEMNETGPGRPNEFVAWLLSEDAERWRRRALFYERHRDYFPRLSSGRFVARCRELEASYRGLSQALWNVTPQIRWVSIRPIVSRID